MGPMIDETKFQVDNKERIRKSSKKSKNLENEIKIIRTIRYQLIKLIRFFKPVQ